MKSDIVSGALTSRRDRPLSFHELLLQELDSSGLREAADDVRISEYTGKRLGLVQGQHFLPVDWHEPFLHLVVAFVVEERGLVEGQVAQTLALDLELLRPQCFRGGQQHSTVVFEHIEERRVDAEPVFIGQLLNDAARGVVELAGNYHQRMGRVESLG